MGRRAVWGARSGDYSSLCRVSRGVELNSAAQLIESYARRLAQTPHTGDEGQDAETYRIVLRAMLEDAEKYVYARALRRDKALEHPTIALCADIGGVLDMCPSFSMGSGADESVRGSESLAAFRDAVK